MTDPLKEIAGLRHRIAMLETIAIRALTGVAVLLLTSSLFRPLWKSDPEVDPSFTFIAVPFQLLGKETASTDEQVPGSLIGLTLIAIIALIVALLSLWPTHARISGWHFFTTALGVCAVFGTWMLTLGLGTRAEENIVGPALLPLTAGIVFAVITYLTTAAIRGRAPSTPRFPVD